MKVKELARLLDEQDPEAEAVIIDDASNGWTIHSVERSGDHPAEVWIVADELQTD